MIDCPHCGRELDIAIRAGSCPHCNGNLSTNSVIEEMESKKAAIPTGTLDLSSFVELEKQNQAREEAEAANAKSKATTNGADGESKSKSDSHESSAPAIPSSGSFATLVPGAEQNNIPTVEGAHPHSSTVTPTPVVENTPAENPPAENPPTHTPTVDLSPPATTDATLQGGTPKAEGPIGGGDSGTGGQAAPQPTGHPTVVGGQTMAGEAPVATPPPSEEPKFSGTQIADSTMVQPPGSAPGALPLHDEPMFENSIPTVQAGSAAARLAAGAGADAGAGRTIGSDAGMPKPPGHSSTGVKQLWEGFADSRVGPMASIKSDDMAVGRDDGLVIHRRQLAPADAPKAGEADYMVVSYLGQGAMGVVFEANQTSMQRGVAIKTLRPELARKAGDRQKFLYEASITGDLDHPNIVPIHDVGVNQDGTLFYSMKRVEGTPWQNVMHTKTRAENLEILMKVADAVSFAHSRDVIHRDLKPENVMLGQFGEVLVMDWGLAVNLSKTKDFVLGGTPAYMAPEMARHQLELIGPTSDIYLLGAILFQAITGLPPHPGETVTQCVSAAARNQIIPVDQKDELLSISLTAMDSDPNGRYATVNDLQNAIREYQDHAESISLANRANEDLEHAVANQDYQAYSRARFGFQDAVKLWPGNEAAEEGFQRANIAHATEALNKQDFDLGMSMLNESNPKEAPLLEQLRQGKKERENRVRRFRVVRRLAFLGLASAVVIAGVGAALVFQQYLRADKERIKAEQQTVEADRQRKKAEANEKIAKDNEKIAVDALAETERQRILAKESEEEALAAKETAEEQKGIAEMQRQEALRQEEIAKNEREAALEAQGLAEASEKEAKRQQANALNATFDVKQSAFAIKLGKLRSDFTLIRNNIASGNVEDAMLSIRRILVNDFPTPDEFYPLSFKGWELYRLIHLAQAGDPTSLMDTLAPAMTVTISGDGSMIAAGDSDGMVYIYDGATQEELRRFPVSADSEPRITAMALSADGSELIVGTRARGQNNLYFVDPNTGDPTQDARVGHDDGVYGVDLSVDGRILATCGIDITSGAGDKEGYNAIRVWSRGGESDPFEVASRSDRHVNYEKNHMIDLAPNNERVLVVCTARAGTDASGKEIKRQVVAVFLKEALFSKPSEPDQNPLTLIYEGGDITCAAFDPRDANGNTIFVGTDDGQILHWQIEKISVTGTGKTTPIVEDSDLISTKFTGHDAASTIRDIDARLIETGNGKQLRLISIADIYADGQSRDPSFILWDVEARNPQKRLFGHAGKINACGQSLDGQFMFSASQDRKIRVWNVSQMIDQLSIVGTAKTNTNDLPDVNSIDFSNNNRWIVGGDRFGRITVSDRSSGSNVASVRIGHQLNQDLKTRLRADADQMISASADGTTRIWQPSSGRLLREWDDSAGLQYFDVSDNGKWLVMGHRVDTTVHLRIVDLDTMAINEFSMGEISSFFVDEQIVPISVRIDDKGQSIYVASIGKLWGFDIANAKPLGEEYTRSAKAVGLQLLPDGTQAAYYGRVSVALFPTSVELAKSPPIVELLHKGVLGDLEGLQVSSLEFVQQGDQTFALMIAIRNAEQGRDNRISECWLGVFDATEWGQLELEDKDEGFEASLLHRALVPIDGNVVDAALHAGGKGAIALLKSNQTVEIDFESLTVTEAALGTKIIQDVVGRISSSFDVNDLSMSQIDRDPSGHLIIAGPGFAELWDATGEERIFQISPALPIRNVRFSQDPTTIYAVHGDGNLRLWKIVEEEASRRVTMGQMIRGDFDRIETGPHENLVILIDKSGRGAVYDVEAGELVIDLPIENVTAADWAAGGDDQSVIMAGTADGSTALYYFEDGGLRAYDIPLEPHSAPITSVAISDDLKYFASGDSQGNGYLIPNPDSWEAHQSSLSLSNTRVAISELHFHPSGNRLVVSQGDRLRLMHVDNERQNLVESVFQLEHGHEVNASAISPDGRLIASAPADEGRIIVWLTKGWNEVPVGEDLQVQREIDRAEIQEALDAAAASPTESAPDSNPEANIDADTEIP